MLLTLTTYAQTPTSLTIADGTSTPPFALVADAVDWGNARWDHTYSGPRGTQGARPAFGVPANRTVTLPLRVYGTDKDNLAANLRSLSSIADELRRFGGRLTWQSAGQTYRQHLEVLGTDGAALGAWSNRPEQKAIAQVDLQLQCAPYATGDPLDITDSTFGSLATDYTVDSGTFANLTTTGGVVKITTGTGTTYRLVHTSRGYDYGDTEVTVQAKIGATLASWAAGAVVWRSAANTYLTAYLDDDGTNSRLRIDQVTAGTLTNRASTTLATRLTTGQTVYIVARTEGTAVTVEFYTAAPTPMATTAATATASWTAPAALTGKAGWFFIPRSTTAEIDLLQVRPFTYARRALPYRASLSGSIPGDAPALAAAEITTRQALPWALLAWQTTPAATTLTGTPTPRAAFTVLNGNDDVAASRAGFTTADATNQLISTRPALSASATFSGTTYTYTTTTAHGLTTGATVTITGAAPSNYNGTFTVTVTGASTFTVTGSSTPATNTTTNGTVIEGARTGVTYQAAYALDPSLLPTDAYADGDRAVELWVLARTDASSKLISPTITASLAPAAGGGLTRYTDEWGSTGRALPTASSTATSPVLRWTRLGTMHLPASGAREMRLTLAITVAAGSAGGQLGLARIVLVPTRQRIAQPTGRAADSTYPSWSTTTTETTKRIESDLATSSWQPTTTTVAVADRSAAGTLLELAPGPLDLLVAASAIVPDDPTASTSTEYLGAATPPTATSQPAATVHLAVTPRYAQLRT